MKTEKYNFNKLNELHLVASISNLRPCLKCIYFDDFSAIVSDGYAILKMPVNRISNLKIEDIHKLNGRLIKAEDYKQIVKFETISISDDGITATKGEKSDFFKFQYERYFDYKKILSGMHKGEGPLNYDMIFSPSRLYNLCRAYGNKDAIPVLKNHGELNAIEVVFDESEDVEAFIMPCRK